MKFSFYLEGKEISVKEARELLKNRYQNFVDASKETFMQDPYIENAVYTRDGMLVISFN